MKLTIYAIFNKKIKEFDFPIFHNLKPEDYYDQARNGVIMGAVKPEQVKDRVLYCLGEFDNKTGLVALLTKPEEIGDFEDLIPTED